MSGKKESLGCRMTVADLSCLREIGGLVGWRVSDVVIGVMNRTSLLSARVRVIRVELAWQGWNLVQMEKEARKRGKSDLARELKAHGALVSEADWKRESGAEQKARDGGEGGHVAQIYLRCGAAEKDRQRGYGSRSW